MAALFCVGMLLYFVLAFRIRSPGRHQLAKLLWVVYFALGLSALFISLTDVLQSVFPPNYGSTFFLLFCVLLAVSSFKGFRSQDIAAAAHFIPGQRQIEDLLIWTQFAAIIFFLPFAFSSLIGDANENRLELASKVEVLASFGIVNTIASAACQLFSSSLIMAFIRLSQPNSSRNATRRALLLLGSSLSYVIYILAYVGRDGIVYWLMTAAMMVIIFRPHLSASTLRLVLASGMALAGLMLVPFFIITLARFVDTQHGSAWSVLEYFGTQIYTFSDYSTLERPLTLGVMNFPMFASGACWIVGLECPTWIDIKEIVFEQYLIQAKEPWLFGTYVSDFVGDFGYWGTSILLLLFALLCHHACSYQKRRITLTLPRLLLILFLFLVPYWGVFFFRFSIVNGYIIVNLMFIVFVYFTMIIFARLRQRSTPIAVDEDIYSSSSMNGGRKT